jgi:hypothetical protein
MITYIILTRGLNYAFVYIVDAGNPADAEAKVKDHLCENEKITLVEDINTTKGSSLAIPLDEE